MYSRLPAFVFGFHGCDQGVKNRVLYDGETLAPSRNEYDWLGSGIYFWEQNPQRAMDFAIKAQLNPNKYSKNLIEYPAVIGAVIDLGNCLNLMDAASIKSLGQAYEVYKMGIEMSGAIMASNKGGSPDKVLRYLDMAVIETLHDMIELHPKGEPYDTVRALFEEGENVYPGAGFRMETHIQICVRNINCIKAFFDPREKNDHPFAFLTKSES